MPGPSPFANDWRDCLRAHYQHVLRNQDGVTERTLTGVLQSIGFNDGELAGLKVLATLRTDDLPPDFVPDLDLLKAEAIAQLQQAAAPPAPEPEPAVFAPAFPGAGPEPEEPAPEAAPEEEEEPPD